ncbi:MAG: Coenzyme F420 hydrogenase/dehydrogenase, beta subunit C-terminal domain, partial [Pseudomonadota bacterium]
GKVDAVLTTMPSKKDRWKPVPVIVTDPDALSECRGMRMGFAPLLSLLGPARSAGYKRLAVIGIPCQIHALRALEAELGFERLYVIGTPCSDNTTTENFWTFLNLLSDTPDNITYLEFRADYRVELRFKDGTQRFIPFLQLPISKLPQSFFPLTCQTCVDYVNTLADITVGYMAGSGDQWLIVRNGRGEEMVEGLGDALVFKPLQSKGNRKSAVEGFKKNVERSAGGLPIRAMPDWLRPIVSFLQPRFGPRGLEFARTRVEMKAIEAVLHLRAKAPRRIKTMVPDHIWKLVKPYGLVAAETETKTTKSSER